MIKDLDTSLRGMLAGEAVPGSELAHAKISFAVPDKDWRGTGKGLDLNVYLYRVLDNRELRSNARRPVYNSDGSVTNELFPSRIECSYIISAWNKATVIPGTDNELQEHRLLSQVFYVLWRNPTMPPQYLVGLLTNAEIALPLVAGETEDMAARPDFWTAIDSFVRPTITCRITIALDIDLDVTGPMMTSANLTLGAGESVYMIGGTVRAALAPFAPIANAWIQLDGGLRTYLTDDNGNFIIDQIAPGPHVLRVRAVGFKENSANIQVPDPSGLYDVSLSP